MQSFKKLLESVRSSNPDLISEDVANQMVTDYENELTQMKSDAEDAGFTKGYREGQKVAADEAKKSFETLLADLDLEATEKLKAVVEMLNEQHAEKLQEVYDKLKEETVSKDEYAALDKECAEKLQEVYECTCKKLTDEKEQAVSEIQEESKVKMESKEKFYNKKIKAVKLLMESKLEAANKLLVEERAKKLDILAEQVEKYLNYALEEKIPAKQLISEQKFNAATKTIQKITSILKINNILQESKDGIFNDYENEIAAQKEQTNKLISENADLKLQLQKQEAKLLLESKLEKSIPGEASFLRNYFKNAESTKIIEEQIEDAKAVYQRLRAEKRNALIKENKAKAPSKPSEAILNENKKVSEKKEQEKPVITESKQKVAEASSFNDVYASILINNK